MSTLIGSIVLTLILFFIVVFVHECGHFLAARSIGVRVKEFGIGIPPRIRSLFRDRHGTLYTLNALPIGGFVRLEGEEMSENGAHSLRSRSLLGKLWVLLAGIGMNFLFAWIVFTLLFFVGVSPLTIHSSQLPFERTSYLIPSFEQAKEMGLVQANGVKIVPMESSPAADARIASGALIESISGERIETPDQAIRLIQSAPTEVSLTYRSQSGIVTPTVITKNNDNRIGAYISYNNLTIHPEVEYRVSLPRAISMGAQETLSQVLIAGESLWTIGSRIIAPDDASERRDAVLSLGGPISAGEGVYDLLEQSVPLKIYLIFAALLSISIGFFNLLPLPALDGGRVLEEVVASTLGVLRLRPKKYDHYVRYYHAAGFILLIGLSILIAIKDIVW